MSSGKQKSPIGGAVVVIAILLFLLFGVALPALFQSDDENVADTQEESTEPASQTESSALSTDNAGSSVDDAALLEDISFSCELDEALFQAIVSIENNGSLTFDATVTVYFYGYDESLTGWDVILVEGLTAGNFTYARIDLDTPYFAKWEYHVSDYSFTKGVTISGGTINTEISEQLAYEFDQGFGGAGDPEYATDWYAYVTKIEVYDSADGQYAVITTTGAGQSDADLIGNAIFANYVYSDKSRVGEIAVVIVVDEATGDKLYERAV
jgi:hypothetical protein